MSKRTSSAQFQIMLDVSKRHPQILNGKFDSYFSKDMKEKVWNELTLALNAVENGPSKSPEGWRKTLKDWKCYVKRKAIRTNEEMSPMEEKLLRAMHKANTCAQNSVEESEICEEVDHEVTIETVYCGPEDNTHNYCENKKSMKRKAAAEISEKLAARKMDEKKMTLLEKKIALLERRTVAAEKKAAAKEQSVSLEERKLRQQWKTHIHDVRMKRLQYLSWTE